MLKERVLTAIRLAPLAVAAVLLLPTQTLAVCAGVICVIGAAEWGRLIGLVSPAGRLAYVAMHSLSMGLLWQYRGHGTLELAAFAGAAWWLLAWLWLVHFEFAASQARRNVWLKGAAGMLTLTPAWSALILIHGGPVAGHWWLLYVLVLIWLADVAAFFTGRLFGHTKLAPRISPGKTYAGVYGALAGTVLLAVAVDLWFESLTLLPLLALSLVTVVFSIIGDLFESLIKRHSNFKDSGALLPGHGGMFDRIDSVVAALPIFALGKLLLGL